MVYILHCVFHIPSIHCTVPIAHTLYRTLEKIIDNILYIQRYMLYGNVKIYKYTTFMIITTMIMAKSKATATEPEIYYNHCALDMYEHEVILNNDFLLLFVCVVRCCFHDISIENRQLTNVNI